ncbi:leucine-rich repeat extensin-like protein 5 [Hevea brasiliensis]|uniref:leucine-rich repeat extensin-like protein 5 n=1 Tax=Hevea brasiliensis TaxID=3981 RepID=UPI0025CE6241|nr:leucine-rich repeat extensin-like protein 5 [Hevea brasiliensis]
MGTPSSLPINPNSSPSPPLPQSPPPQTPPLPQSPPLPQGQTPTLILPTPFSPQTAPQNETLIFETQSPDLMPEPVPTQTKSKGKTKKAAGRPKKTTVRKRKGAPSVPFDLNSPPQPSSELVSKRTRSFSHIPPPAVQTLVSQSPLNSPAAPASSANDIEEVLSPLPWAFKGMDMKNSYESLASKPILANKVRAINILSGNKLSMTLFNSGKTLHLLGVITDRGLQKPLE